MASPRLKGPFLLTEQSLDAHVQSRSPGVYVLGYVRKSLFVVSYVDRDDTDLKTGIKAHTGVYQQFKFAYAISARDAFRKQCELYHDYVGLDNKCHPSPPDGIDLPCARCKDAVATQ